MKKILSKVLCVLIICVMMFSTFSFTSSAAAAYISLSPNTTTLNPDQTLTVTVTYDAGEPIYSVDGALSYNSAVLQYVSGGSSNTGSSVKIVESPSGETSVSYTINFKAIAVGSSALAFNMYGVNEALQKTEAGSASVSITVENPPPAQPSSNASLSSLKVSGATLSPAFKAGTTKYTATVKHKTDKVTISGNAVDGGSCEGLGTFNVNVGENVRYITVTAADGKTKKTYTVTIIRNAEGQDEEDIVDSLTVTIDDTDHTVVREAPESAPVGFKAESATYNDREVTILKSEDEKISMYLLENNETKTVDYYTYDQDTNQFSLLKYSVINGKMYIFVDNEDTGVAEGYEKTEVQLGNSVVEVYKSTNKKLSDFYIVYCFVEGTYGYYSYDSLEGTIQRAPAFKLVEIKPVEEEEEKEVISSFKDILKLNGKAKALLIVLLVIAICIITLIVLVIVRFVKIRKAKREDDESEFYDDDLIFDEVNIDDNSGNNDIIM